ncbi:MAG: hypothetical protein H6739_00235 [Alphaproteobacteria bacterium]|nr:hypothetical protein [Alphaproteobacteria bacterium]
MIAALLLAAVACGGPGEAERYSAALDPSLSLERAVALCEGMATPERAGECAVAAIEARGALSAAACAQVPAGLWREECLFLTAEAVLADGHLEAAMAGCRDTRFARECSFHLIRAEAQAAALLDPAEAAAQLASLPVTVVAPDAARLFWREWLRARQSAGRSVDPAACRALPDPAPCDAALMELWLAAISAMPRDRFCALRAEVGRTPLTLAGGAPAFADDPALVAHADRYCDGLDSTPPER